MTPPMVCIVRPTTVPANGARDFGAFQRVDRGSQPLLVVEDLTLHALHLAVVLFTPLRPKVNDPQAYSPIRSLGLCDRRLVGTDLKPSKSPRASASTRNFGFS